MKETCGICGQWKGLHEANTWHCPVDGTESGLFTETTYQDSEGMEATIEAQAKRIAELENLFADAKDIIDAKNKQILDLKRNKGIDEMKDTIDAQAARIAELEAALAPFSAEDFCQTLGGNFSGDDSIVFERKNTALKLGHFRTARKLLGEQEPECPHERGTVYRWKTYPATREEPSETVGRLHCDECGKEFELGDEPEEMELRWIEDAEYMEDR